jgi:hypothetical protein
MVQPACTTVTLCGCPGHLSVIASAPPGDRPPERRLMWRTDTGLLRRAKMPVGAPRSLFEVACEIADLYHRKHPLNLAEGPGEGLEVIWLELAADDSLLVLLKPAAPLPY